MHRRTLLVSGVAAGLAPLLSAPATAQVKSALSPEDEALVRAFLEAISGGAAERRDFLSARVAPAPRLPRDRFPKVMEAMAGTSGKLNLVSASRRGDMVRLIVTSAKGRTGRIDLDAPPQAQGKLMGLMGFALPAPWAGGFPKASLSREALVAALEARVQYAVERDDFSGSILISRGPETVYSRAVGLADREKNQPNTLQTRFNLGSMGKQFTAVAVGQLMDQGRLTLETRLIDLLPDYPNPDAARRITIRNLLTHSAGLGMLFDRPGWDFKLRYERMSELFPLFAKAPLDFEPGTQADYSNEGFIVLGAVVERLTGKSWYDAVQSAVFDRVGMAATASLTDDPTVPARAAGYAFGEEDPLGFGARHANWATVSRRGNSCGGNYSTVGDMTRFLQALKAGQLMSAERTGGFTAQAAGGLQEYGMGFMTVPLPNGRRLVGHDGGGPRSGINSDAKMVWETGWTYAVLGNYDAPFAQALGRDLGQIISVQD